MSSRLVLPVQGVVTKSLVDTWGAPRSGGRLHEGIDIFARRNTPVLCAADGVVTRVGTSSLGGLVIWIRDGRGLDHYYAHLEAYGPFVEGDYVRAGETIGYVGTSGNAATTPPHLHYGIYTATGAVNPYPLLTQGIASSS